MVGRFQGTKRSCSWCSWQCQSAAPEARQRGGGHHCDMRLCVAYVIVAGKHHLEEADACTREDSRGWGP